MAAGCAAKAPLTSAEKEFLEGLSKNLAQVRDQYREFEKFDQNVEHGLDFISYSNDLSQKPSSPLLNPNYFWFKISLTENALDSFDLQPPILTIFMPSYNKFLKLRISTGNEPLMKILVKIFYDSALSLGGTDVRWGDPNARPMPGQRRSGRSMSFMG